jgi:hypothetical protein
MPVEGAISNSVTIIVAQFVKIVRIDIHLGVMICRFLHAPTGTIDRCTRFAKRTCDAAAGSPRRASDKRDASSDSTGAESNKGSFE